MKLRLRSGFTVVLMIIVCIFFPSVLQSENAGTFMKEIQSGAGTASGYTDNMERKALRDSYLRSEKEFFAAQKFEQRKNVFRAPVVFFVFLIFSLGVYLKRVYLSYIQFNQFLFARFLCEYYILLEKDGKKRKTVFV